jgi:hypothetical protein
LNTLLRGRDSAASRRSSEDARPAAAAETRPTGTDQIVGSRALHERALGAHTLRDERRRLLLDVGLSSGPHAPSPSSVLAQVRVSGTHSDGRPPSDLDSASMSTTTSSIMPPARTDGQRTSLKNGD